MISDNKKKIEDAHCYCTRKHKIPNWCDYWSGSISKPFCILSGGLASQFCPGAIRLTKHGQPVGDYFSSDEAICNKSERKLFDKAWNTLWKFFLFRNNLMTCIINFIKILPINQFSFNLKCPICLKPLKKTDLLEFFLIFWYELKESKVQAD